MSGVLKVARTDADSLGESAAASPDFVRLIPREYARRHLAVSRGTDVLGHERLAVSASPGPFVVSNIAVRLMRQVECEIASAEDIAAEIDRAYANAAPSIPLDNAASDFAVNENSSTGRVDDDARFMLEGTTDLDAELATALKAAEDDADVLNIKGKAPAIRLVDLILFEALLRGGSDIHVQPVRGRTLVRYRLDGVLHTVRSLPASLANAVVSRIKIMARMDIAERRAPQDGRAGITVGGSSAIAAGRRVDLRVSALPSTYGERVVIRLLDPSRSPHLTSFSALGMPSEIERKYLSQVSRTSGIVLSTGPTGSGKTTTLYATLAWITGANTTRSDQLQTVFGQTNHSGCELNIMTIEDPVEYDLASGPAKNQERQSSVFADGGQSNAIGDPSNVRGSTSEGLTISQTQVDPKKGLTFAAGLRHILRQDPDVIMIGEIRDEETARIAVQSSLTGHLVLSTLHTNDAPSAVARLLDLAVEPFLVSSSLNAVLAQRLVRMRHLPCHGKGCPECYQTGYRGRTGVFELLIMDPKVRDAVGRHASSVEIKAFAEKAGMIPLKEAGARLVSDGVTTREELSRVIETIDLLDAIESEP